MGAPSGTVTFLFTDIEGSTRRWEEMPETMRDALARHDEVVRRAIEGHGGYVFATGGDGFAAAFGRAGDAVAAAVEAQGMLNAEAWPEGTVIRVRMGLHTGEAVEREGDYFGPAVNRAARLMALANGGQVLCSSVTAELAQPDVPPTDLGEHRLRDLSAPQRVFQVGKGEFPPPRSLDAAPGNLPIYSTSFVGRQAELAAVVDDLRASRLVTLTGVGGVGKTRLAVQAAAELLPEFPDGVWLCELAAAATVADLARVVAAPLGVLQRELMTLEESIVDFLRTRHLLVVLDNCEHLLDATAELAEAVLAGAPKVAVLATSREGLGIPEEHVRPLRSLPVAGADPRSSDAVVLFSERARAVAPEFVIDERSGPSVVEVCRRLDGIPLAIELAAARVAAMSPSEIEGHLDERFRLLTGGRRGRVERHQTLRAAIEWSYSMLDNKEREVFERLGVFPASFDERAAVAVCTPDGLDRWDVIDALGSLVAKSMLGAEHSTDATRYQLLETLRHFARDQAGADSDIDELRRFQARHFATVAEQVGAGLRSANERPWHSRLVSDLDNFRAAVFWSLDSASDDDAELAMRIIVNLDFSADWGWTGIGAWAEQAVERARVGDPRYRGVVLAYAAGNAFYRGDFALGRTLSAEAVRDAAVPGTLFPGAVYAAAAIFARPDDLLALLARGLEVVQRAQASDWEFAHLRTAVAAMAAIGGQMHLAEAEATSALALGRRLGYPYIVAMALYTQALSRLQSHPEAALASLDEYVGMVRTAETTSRQVLARCQALAAQIRAAGGDLPRALDDLRQAIDAAHSSGDRPAMAFTLARAVFVLCSDDPATAAVLSGVTGGGVLVRQFPVLTWEREWFRHTVDRITGLLGDEPYRTAFSRGAALTYDDAVATALDAVERLSRR